MAAPTLPPVPYKVTVTDDSGFLSSPWSNFFVVLYQRVGAAVAKTNIELEQLQSSDVATLQATDTSLSTRITALESAISSVDGFDFNQGPNL